MVDARFCGTPSLDHAETWVNALRKAIYMAPQNERIGRAVSVVEDVDEEDDQDDHYDLLAVSPSGSSRTRLARQPLHYGDKLRFWTKSVYLERGHPGDFVGVYEKRKMVGGRLFAVRPAGKRSDLPIVTSTFVVQDPCVRKARTWKYATAIPLSLSTTMA